MIDENFYSLLATLASPYAVEEAKVSEFQGQTRVWFQRSGEKTERHLDGSAGLTTTEFDVEVHSTDISTSQDLADALKAGLDAYYGTMGAQAVDGIFVEDHDDNYVPKGLMGDAGFFVPALKVTVMHG